MGVLFERVNKFSGFVFAHQLDIPEGRFLFDCHAGDDVLEILQLHCGFVLQSLNELLLEARHVLLDQIPGFHRTQADEVGDVLSQALHQLRTFFPIF